MGVLMTLILVIFTSVIGMSLVRNQGFKNFLLMQQKMAAGESPAEEMIKSVSLIIAGLLLLLPGFFTDFLGLLLLLPPVQKHLTMKLLPHLRFPGCRVAALAPEPAVATPLTASSSAKMKNVTVSNTKTIVATDSCWPGKRKRHRAFSQNRPISDVQPFFVVAKTATVSPA